MYQVVFTGRLLPDADRATVEHELVRLFKATPQQVAWFLRGKAIVVKSCDDKALAQRYEAALTKAGLECELRSDAPAVKAVEDPPPPRPTQLPMPGVAAPVLDKTPPATAKRAAPARRAPTLGPVTGAITAQDRAPQFVARDAERAAQVPHPVMAGVTERRIGLIMLAALLCGVLGYVLAQRWQARQEGLAAVTPGRVPAVAEDLPATAAPPPPAEPMKPEQLILGRWQCFENQTGRVVQNEFRSDGSYRSLSYGRAEAFLQIEQIDVLVEGNYRMDGKKVVLHVLKIPSRAQFGESESTDDYLYWNIQALNDDVLVWHERRLFPAGESCLRSVSLSPRLG